MMTAKCVPVVQGLFADTAQGPRLLGSKCVSCGTPYFPKSPVCRNPECGNQNLEDATFGPRGTLWSFAIQHYAPPPPVKYDEPYTPYAIGLVDMPEGLRILARLSTTNIESITVGMEVELVIDGLYADPQGNQVTTWKFRPL
jgi:uncharacterized OB-fold protein